ncbi:MAG: DNA-directed RNA polymerase subunit P [Candidatus Aenigmarchaeota archaeon]|nr:DNA-directed RNA polymerase subunit P [Candidatus Aenigmarchaeota archaeon]
MYICLSCKKEIEFDEIRDKIRCPYCGYKVIMKQRPKTITKVPAK